MITTLPKHLLRWRATSIVSEKCDDYFVEKLPEFKS